MPVNSNVKTVFTHVDNKKIKQPTQSCRKTIFRNAIGKIIVDAIVAVLCRVCARLKTLGTTDFTDFGLLGLQVVWKI